jgi:ferritin-like metal-binding protein YciE
MKNDLEKLFVSELKDIYDGEHQLIKALGEMKKVAVSTELKNAFRSHLQQTKGHVNRLEQVFDCIGEKPRRKPCQAIEGIIDEGQTVAKEFAKNTALDAALITAGQKAEHYEITSYGSLCAWAQELGAPDVYDLLQQNLGEEKEADAKLTQLAVTARNPEAAMHDTQKRSSTAANFSKVMSHGT